MKSIDVTSIKSIFIVIFPYILIQALINKLELLYIPILSQVIYVILAIVTSKYIFARYGFNKSFLLLLIPLVNLLTWRFLLSSLDGIYLGVLFLNGIFYMVSCVIVIIKDYKKIKFKEL